MFSHNVLECKKLKHGKCSKLKNLCIHHNHTQRSKCAIWTDNAQLDTTMRISTMVSEFLEKDKKDKKSKNQKKCKNTRKLNNETKKSKMCKAKAYTFTHGHHNHIRKSKCAMWTDNAQLGTTMRISTMISEFL
jgi:hypothetical protein